MGQYQTSSFFYTIAIGVTIALCLTCSTFDIVGIYKLTEFEGYLAEMREFILKSITRLFEEMG